MSVRAEALDDKVTLLARTLTEADIPHAFGGAIALAYYAEPRATIDIDLNIFLSADKSAAVIHLLRPLGITVDERANLTLGRDGQARLRWDLYILDVFFVNHPFHEQCAARTRTVPFRDGEIRILSAEDLVVFKILFNRPKDWLDIEQVLFAQAGRFDIGYVEHWLAALVGADDERGLRLREATRNVSGGVAPESEARG